MDEANDTATPHGWLARWRAGRARRLQRRSEIAEGVRERDISAEQRLADTRLPGEFNRGPFP
jgi:hypothetical protein